MLQTQAKDVTRAPWRTIRISKPLVTHAGEVTAIPLREPTLGDFISFGDIDAPMATEFEDGRATVLRTHTDRNALMSWTTALTGLDHFVLGQLGPTDAGALFEAVRLAVEPFSRTVPEGNSQSAPTNSSSSSGSTLSTSRAPLYAT